MHNIDWFEPAITNSVGEFQQYFEYPTSKVVCVGRNYVAHAKELNNPVPDSPLLFIKPNSSLVNLAENIRFPLVEGGCHHELEVAILIGQKVSNIKKEDSLSAIAGIGLGLDLTLRGIQSKLKSKGQPWEKAKAFDGACPISGFMPYTDKINLKAVEFSMLKNGQLVQSGNTADMMFPIDRLISEISSHFTLYPGDIIMTGTPEGVGKLSAGDHLTFTLQGQCWGECEVANQSNYSES